MHRKRTLLALAVLAVASLTLTGAAFAGSSAKRHHHKQAAKIARAVAHRRAVARRVRKTFAPTAIIKAAEVSAVELDPLTQKFMQVTFDRGRITAVSSSSITLEQRQANVVWRTQAFTVPSTAVVTLNGRATTLAQLPTGVAARIVSSGTPGGAQTVVRVNAYSRGEAPLPAST